MTPDELATLRPGHVVVFMDDDDPGCHIIERRKDDDTGWWMTDGSGLADWVALGDFSWWTVPALIAALREAWATEGPTWEAQAEEALSFVSVERDNALAEVERWKAQVEHVVAQANAEHERLTAALDRVRALHTADGLCQCDSGQCCATCDDPWPCATLRATEPTTTHSHQPPVDNL